MEKIVEFGLLFDFYGALLSDHQQKVYSEYVYDNLSISEIASSYNISRQAVFDLIKRCDKALMEYEEKLHLVAKFIDIKNKVAAIQQMTDSIEVSKMAQMIIDLV